MKTLLVWITGVLSFAISGVSMAPNHGMMNSDMWYGSWLNGRGGIWMPTLIVIVVVGVVVWFLAQSRE